MIKNPQQLLFHNIYDFHDWKALDVNGNLLGKIGIYECQLKLKYVWKFCALTDLQMAAIF